MSNLLHKLKLILAGILIGAGAGAFAQVGSGVGTSAPPVSSDPTFDSIQLGSTTATVGTPLRIEAGTNASLTLLVDNDNNGTTNSARTSWSSGDSNVALFIAGSGRTGTLVTGGVTGAHAVLRTLGNYPLLLASSNTQRMKIDGDGTIYHGPESALVDATHESGSFAASTAGCSGTEIDLDVFYERAGRVVSVEFDVDTGLATCTSDATTFAALTNVNAPAWWSMTSNGAWRPLGGTITDNGSNDVTVCARVNSVENIDFSADCIITSSFTASGTKGFATTSGRINGFTFMLN